MIKDVTVNVYNQDMCT